MKCVAFDPQPVRARDPDHAGQQAARDLAKLAFFKTKFCGSVELGGIGRCRDRRLILLLLPEHCHRFDPDRSVVAEQFVFLEEQVATTIANPPTCIVHPRVFPEPFCREVSEYRRFLMRHQSRLSLLLY